MFKEPYIGMPIFLGNCCNDEIAQKDNNTCNLDKLPLAMSYVPFQSWSDPYSLAQALNRGTIFPDLDLPFKGGKK